MTKRTLVFLRECAMICLGSLIFAVGLNCFLVPFKLSSGGISTIATVLLYTAKIPMAVTNLVLNAFLFVVGYRCLGRSSVIKTAVGILSLSLLYEVTAHLPLYSEDMIVGTLVGGVCAGVGIGIVVKQEASTGGSDFAALILHRLIPHISVANFLLLIDSIIILAAGLVFRSITVTCYSIIAVFLCSKISDFVCTNGNLAKAVYIMSPLSEEISREIMTKYGRGVTGLSGRGMYSGEEKTTLLCVVMPKELPSVLRAVKRIDREAFVIVTSASDVFGEGFRVYR